MTRSLFCIFLYVFPWRDKSVAIHVILKGLQDEEIKWMYDGCLEMTELEKNSIRRSIENLEPNRPHL